MVATTLAQNCSVSVRTLPRHFLQQAGKNTKTWLAEQRLKHAIELMSAGSSIKAVSSTLGYKHHSSFTRKFKIARGICPTLATIVASVSLQWLPNKHIPI